jgi:demethylmenaquinone methyltransferase/2-methoxy-6-polyprenyl-1,4-benzoquinol methylase
VPLLARLVGRSAEMPHQMRYNRDTNDSCVPPVTVQARLRAAGFTDIERHVEAGIFSEYRARKPG